MLKNKLSIIQIFLALIAILIIVAWLISNDAEVKNLLLASLGVLSILELLQILYIRYDIQTRQEASKMATELAGANMRLERLDKMKTEFVSVASHQLRSPLTSIKGYVSMILEGSYGKTNTKIRKALEHVADAAENMSLSVEDYLNVSRIEAGNMKYDIKPVNLKEVVERLVEEMVPVGIKKGIPLVFKSNVKGSIILKLDAGKTKQILQNLIDNAFKYTPGKGVITVSLYKSDNNKEVLVSVTDQGVGIDKSEINNIFNKFERAKNANAVNVSGTGLGLYIAKAMTEAMKGRLEVSSEGVDKGSTFSLIFPLNKS